MSINRVTKGRSGVRGVGLQGLTVQTVNVQLPASAASGTEVDLGVKIPAKSLVLGVYVDMATGASSATPLMDVGTLSTASGGDADGFLASINIASAGLVQGAMVASARTLGALSFEGTAASILFTKPYLCDIERNLSFTSKGVANAMKGEITVLLLKL